MIVLVALLLPRSIHSISASDVYDDKSTISISMTWYDTGIPFKAMRYAIYNWRVHDNVTRTPINFNFNNGIEGVSNIVKKWQRALRTCGLEMDTFENKADRHICNQITDAVDGIGYYISPSRYIINIIMLFALLYACAYVIRKRKKALMKMRQLRGECVHCGYNLYGITELRCPECGCATKSLEKEDCEVGNMGQQTIIQETREKPGTDGAPG